VPRGKKIMCFSLYTAQSSQTLSCPVLYHRL
jgi:hypothetical protein